METERLLAKRPGFRLSFRLRTLLLLILAICAVCAALSWKANQVRRRSAAEDLLRYHSVSVGWHERAFYAWIPSPLWRLMGQWLLEYRDLDFFGPCVMGGELRDEQANTTQRQEILSAILLLAELEELTISLNMRDEDLAMLSNLSELRHFWFRTCGVTDQGISHLEKLEKLQYLHIYSDPTCRISPEAIMRLNRLPKLGFIHITPIDFSAEDASRIRAAFPNAKVELRVNGD